MQRVHLKEVHRSHYVQLGHTQLERYSLTHKAFPTSFVLSAGVIDMRDALEGAPARAPRRVLAQPCFRHFDVNRLGTGHHLSLFVMGGALYLETTSPTEVLTSLMDLLVGRLGLECERLWISYFAGGDVSGQTLADDRTSVDAAQAAGVDNARIVGGSAKTNLWREGAGSGRERSGLCGPHTEVFFDRGSKTGCGESSCDLWCSCGRFIEIANTVYPRFAARGESLVPLEREIAEAVIGFERLEMVIERVQSVWETSRLIPYYSSVKEVLPNAANGQGWTVVADHVRAFCCLVAEGARPAGRGRGHVLRSLIRRAVDSLGKERGNAAKILPAVADELVQQRQAQAEINLDADFRQIRSLLEMECQRIVEATEGDSCSSRPS